MTVQFFDPRMAYKPTFNIVLADGRGFGDVLADIQTLVTRVLDAPEIAAAVA